ncbi:hypothetical protein DFP72DRAFT_1051783 [Ephemerocybe angulata]|uniref:Ricin B lectin domain-containing protein n=1 Tax=Ephemerocybe angulata TaxID=980116 RepID=A0A8H6HEM6_9AGAR|nr:hypothetical protein DFP72DRAFT_1051783 [Tulosesus angulatus]
MSEPSAPDAGSGGGSEAIGSDNAYVEAYKKVEEWYKSDRKNSSYANTRTRCIGQHDYQRTLDPYTFGVGKYQTSLEDAVAFFEREEKLPDRSSLGTLINAHRLLFIFSTMADAVASAVKRASSTISARASPFGTGPRKEVGTGVHYVRADTNDGVYPSLVGKKENDPGMPKPFNRAALVNWLWEKSEAYNTIIPDAVAEFAKQRAKTNAGNTKLYGGVPMTIPPTSWYRLSNPSISGAALDIVNDGSGSPSGILQIAATANVSGQYWVVRKQPSNPGAYYLSAMYQGPQARLDVYGDDKTRPHLAASGNYSGQMWRITKWGNDDGTYKLWNDYSGEGLLLTGRSGSINLEASEDYELSQHWIFTAIQPVTESEFQV